MQFSRSGGARERTWQPHGKLKKTPRSQTAVLIGDSCSACVVRSMVCKSKFQSPKPVTDHNESNWLLALAISISAGHGFTELWPARASLGVNQGATNGVRFQVPNILRYDGLVGVAVCRVGPGN